MSDAIPMNFEQISQAKQFCFACHPGVPCFTECCRELDLALTPYDVLRLKQALKIHSGRLLEQYVIIEWEPSQIFPTCYLTMVDDGRASCVFVEAKGCSVYEDRPGSCRAYPVGRGASRRADGVVEESFILIKEPHCKGFEENGSLTTETFFEQQGLKKYNQFNDAVIGLTQHEQIKNGFRPSKEQLDQYILALYNLDTFRQEMADGRLKMNRPLGPLELQALAGDDEELLLLAVRWLLQEYFNE